MNRRHVAGGDKDRFAFNLINSRSDTADRTKSRLFIPGTADDVRKACEVCGLFFVLRDDENLIRDSGKGHDQAGDKRTALVREEILLAAVDALGLSSCQNHRRPYRHFRPSLKCVRFTMVSLTGVGIPCFFPRFTIAPLMKSTSVRRFAIIS